MQWRVAKTGIFPDPLSPVVLFLAEPFHSTRWALMRWDLILAVYVAAVPSRLAPVGGAITGKIRLRTMAMAAPQQRQTNLGRTV